MINMFMPFFLVGTILMILAFLTLSLQRKHLLNALLSLEMMVLSLFIMLLSLSSMMSEAYLSFIILSLGACEASIGLAMLVMLIRTHGNDYVFSLTTHKC